MARPEANAWMQTALGIPQHVLAGGSPAAVSPAAAPPSAAPQAPTLPQPMGADCKIVRGKVPGPAHHVLCSTHNHVVDEKARMIIALSLDDYKKRFGQAAHSAPAAPGHQGQAKPQPQPAKAQPKPGGGMSADAAKAQSDAIVKQMQDTTTNVRKAADAATAKAQSDAVVKQMQDTTTNVRKAADDATAKAQAEEEIRKRAQDLANQVLGRGGSAGSGREVKAPEPGSGGEFHDASSVTFKVRAVLYANGTALSDTNLDGAVEIKAGQSGQLMVFTHVHGFQDNLTKNETFDQDFQVSWDVSANAAGELTIETPQEEIKAPTTGTWYRLDSINPANGKAFVQISPVVVGGSNSGGISVGVGVGNQAAPAKIKETFRCDIKVKVPKPEPATPAKKIEYTIGPFKVGSSTELDGGSLTKTVYDIFQHSLPQATRDELTNGKLAGGEPIEVHGYTSNTDSEARNFKLSQDRIKAVMAAFEAVGVPKSAFGAPQPHGEWETKDGAGMGPTDDKKKEKESPEWRKVVVKVKQAGS